MYARILIRAWNLILPGWRWLVWTPGWGFYTVQRGIDPAGYCSCPRPVENADVWHDSWCEDYILSFPGGNGSTKPKLGFSKQSIGLGFPHPTGRHRPWGPPPRLMAVKMYRTNHDAGIGPILSGERRWASGVGVSTACGAVSTRGVVVFISFVSVKPRMVFGKHVVGLGFLHRTGRNRPGGPPLFGWS